MKQHDIAITLQLPPSLSKLLADMNTRYNGMYGETKCFFE